MTTDTLAAPTRRSRKPRAAKPASASAHLTPGDDARGIPAGDSPGVSPGANSETGLGRSPDEIYADLDKAAERLEKCASNFDTERKRAINAEMEKLNRELELSLVKRMPVSPAIGVKFQEMDIPVQDIQITGNHRDADDEAETLRLARTITTYGLQQRIGVREIPGRGFELIFGARRTAAFKANKAEAIPAKVYPSTLTAAQVEIIRTIENFGRKDLTHVERTLAVARTLDAIEKTIQESDVVSSELTRAIDAVGGRHEYVAQQLGYPVRWVKDHAYVSQLGGKARELLAAHRIGIEHARELAKLGDKEVADDLADSAAKNEDGTGGESVAQLRQWVVGHMRSLKIVPWRLEVAFGKGVKDCTGHACITCPFNSKTNPDLFGGSIADEPQAGTCTNEGCFQAKQGIAEKALGKFVEKVGAKLKGKKDDERAISQTTFGNIVPPEVKPATAFRKANSVLNPKAPAAPKERSGAGYNYQETPKQKAERSHGEAMRKWHSACVDKIFEKARGVPGAMLAMNFTELFGIWDWGDAQPALIKKAAEWLEILFTDGSLENFAVIENLMKTAGFERDIDFPVKLIPWFLTKWKIAVDPAPQLKDFLPKEEKPKAKQQLTPGESPGAKSSGIKSSGKGGKKKSAKRSRNAPPIEEGEIVDGGDLADLDDDFEDGE
jgi:ParB-like chromosome segregation protein Spo0J